jgi:hypothetical protein
VSLLFTLTLTDPHSPTHPQYSLVRSALFYTMCNRSQILSNRFIIILLLDSEEDRDKKRKSPILDASEDSVCFI